MNLFTPDKIDDFIDMDWRLAYTTSETLEQRFYQFKERQLNQIYVGIRE